MNVRKTILICILIILAIPIGYFAWENRASKEVVLASVAIFSGIVSLVGQKSMTKVILASLAIAGGIIALWFNLNEEIHSEIFYRAYIYNTKTEVSLDDYSLSFIRHLDGPTAYSTKGFVREAIAAFKEETENEALPPFVQLRLIYRNVLFRQILDVLLYLYSDAWHIQIDRLGLPMLTLYWEGPQEIKSDLTSDYINISDIQTFVPSIDIIGTRLFSGDELTLPPGSEFNADSSSITIENSFVDLNISIKCMNGGDKLGGLGSLLQCQKEVISGYLTLIYKVSLLAKFNPRKSGHPDMPKYRQWASVMFRELKRELDLSQHWQSAKGAYLLRGDRINSRLHGY